MRAVVLAAVTAVALAGCSSTAEEPEDPTADPTDAADVGWSPCDGLTAAQVGRIAGEPMRERTGTRDAPSCTFLPVEKGGPAYDISYLFFDGGLETALDTMGAVATQLEPVDVPGAEAARLAVRERPSGILVTGFVQTDGLVQSVNAVRLNPYVRDAFVTSATDLLAALAREAPPD